MGPAQLNEQENEMPRVNFVKAAAKDNSLVKKGESYYWWKFRFGGKHMSLTPPKPSQLTQSPYTSGVLALQEMVDEFPLSEVADLEMLRDDVDSQLDEIKSTVEDSLSNMPDGLQQGETGSMMQERIDACDNAQSDAQSLDVDFTSDLADVQEGDDPPTEEELAEELSNWLEEKRNELSESIGNCVI
jgi:hypothetical protein